MPHLNYDVYWHSDREADPELFPDQTLGKVSARSAGYGFFTDRDPQPGKAAGLLPSVNNDPGTCQAARFKRCHKLLALPQPAMAGKFLALFRLQDAPGPWPGEH